MYSTADLVTLLFCQSALELGNINPTEGLEALLFDLLAVKLGKLNYNFGLFKIIFDLLPVNIRIVVNNVNKMIIQMISSIFLRKIM